MRSLRIPPALFGLAFLEAVLLPQKTALAAGTLTVRGSTTNFTVYYDDSLGANGAALADAVLATCEADFIQLQSYFSNITPGGLPFIVNILPGDGHAEHPGCGSTAISCYVTPKTDADATRFLVAAEVSEVLMDAQNAGWDCSASNGEALSRVLAAEIVYPAKQFLGSTASAWLKSDRVDWVTNTKPGAGLVKGYDAPSLGCSALFINYLRHQLHFSLAQIVQAGGSTLQQAFTHLTGQTNAFGPFADLLQAYFPSGMGATIPTDHPFPLLTPSRLPNNLFLGDIDGDGIDEFLHVSGGMLSVTRTDLDGTKVLQHAFMSPLIQVVVGDFTNQGREHGRDQVVVILADGSMQALAISDDLKGLWWWFTQGSIVDQGEVAIVGDFDGDGAQDILVHDPIGGGLRMYSRMEKGYFDLMPNFTLGNLGSANLVGTQILAGKFGQTAGRDDLVVIDHQAGQVSRYDSATDDTGTTTFNWAFTSNAGIIAPDDQVVVAHLDDQATEDLLIRSISSGTYRMCGVEYGTGDLVGVPGVAAGQLPVQTGHCLIAATRLKEADLRSEPGGTIRHDVLFFNADDGTVTRTDGRYDGSQFTYWWGYTKAIPT